MDPPNRLVLGILVALLCCCLLPESGQAIDNKCSACVAIQTELSEVLSEEKPLMKLDMRNRLNSQGKREGKVIDYKDSELRIIRILENLCERLKKYSLKGSGGPKKRIWVQGTVHVTDHMRMVSEEQGKELKRWCDRMLEEYEDDMTDMIREGGKKNSYADIPLTLCRNITGHCKDEAAYKAEAKKAADHMKPNIDPKATGGPSIEVTEQEAPGDTPDLEDEGAKTDKLEL